MKYKFKYWLEDPERIVRRRAFKLSFLLNIGTQIEVPGAGTYEVQKITQSYPGPVIICSKINDRTWVCDHMADRTQDDVTLIKSKGVNA